MAERELTCQQLVELITSYLDDALPQADYQRLERHLALCLGCRAYLEQMRVTLQVLGGLSTEDIPEDLREELLTAFRSLRKNTDAS